MNTVTEISSAVVYGNNLRVFWGGGKVWLSTIDLTRVLEYSTMPMGSMINRMGVDQSDTALAKIDGKGCVKRIYTEKAVRLICKIISESSAKQRQGIPELIKWLDAGGMSMAAEKYSEPNSGESDTNFPEPESISYTSVIDPDEEPSPEQNDASEVRTLRLVSATPIKVPDAHHDKVNAYCRDLLKVLLRYSDVMEAEHLRQVIESEVSDLIAHRHCPGLNAARYELYRRYWLQGGEA